MAVSRAKRFQAVLERGDRALGWTIARVPFEPGTVWKEMVRLRVRGEVNGFAFRTSLFPYAARGAADGGGAGGFYLLVNRAMQAGARVELGDTAEFRLEPDLEPREAELPDELAVLLESAESDAPGLRAWYDGLSEYTRREIGRWVLGVKSAEARMRRAQQMAERLLATMEAEVELPPVIEAAFRLRPKARAGWGRMTAAQRRGELFAVFYYQTPEARQRRVEKLVEMAEGR
ncbi:MAG TPA: YdeI/OmpD-associated family protein [Granulicella sp.]|nr:YdeI/OmpD-associated family protein [Granulicella sp.]